MAYRKGCLCGFYFVGDLQRISLHYHTLASFEWPQMLKPQLQESLNLLGLAVFLQEVCHALSDRPNLFNGRQEDNTEMVRRFPIESCSLHH